MRYYASGKHTKRKTRKNEKINETIKNETGGMAVLGSKKH